MDSKTANRLLSYDEVSGVLTWVDSPRLGIPAGSPVTSIRTDGYLQIGIGGKRYMVHRVIWLMKTGKWPKRYIDHIDGCRDNNAWSNLREVCPSENAQNIRCAHRDNAHGLLGVSFIRGRKSKPYRSEIRYQGRQIRLGTFATAEEAHAAYMAQKRILHGNELPTADGFEDC